jgi:predicted DNA-binding protein (MmcQ/YjbR family)
MAPPGITYVDDVPEEIEERLRAICLALPDAHEQVAWKGTRWMVRKKTFASVLGIDDAEGLRSVLLAFRSEGDELEMFRHSGHPFLMLEWGRDAVGLVLDDNTDWDEVRELVTDSYCVMAPKKLAAQVDRPPEPT